jgi:type I restriction enzyme M protein
LKEQEYSLNPGRYVGVVIEEDGKTEEEFIAEIIATNDEMELLGKQTQELDSTIRANVKLLVGEV